MTASRKYSLVTAVAVVLAASSAYAQPTNALKAQEVFAPYWTTGAGWETEMQLKNNLALGSLTVTPVLRTASGREIALDPVTIAANASASVWVDEGLLAHAPGLLHQPDTYGSVVFRFTSFHAQNLYADAVTSLRGGPIEFHAAAYPAADFAAWPRAAGAGSQEGIWWQPRPGGNDFLVVSNSSDKLLPATLWLSDAAGKRWSRALKLAARQTQRLDVHELVSASGLSGTYGGIKIEVPVYAGALRGIHFSYDETAKTSAFFKMFNRDPNAKFQEREAPGENRPWTMWAPMLALSTPDSALGLAPGTMLQPTIFVRNTTAKKLAASITLDWRGDSGKGEVKLPELSLAPYTTQQLQIGVMQKQLNIPDDAHWALVTLSSNAMPDDLMAFASSDDASGRYGAEVAFSDRLGGHFAGGEWKVDANHNELMTVTNGGTKPADALLTLYYGNGTKKYELEQHIAPGEQMWVNLADLIHNRIADRKGNLLPTGLTSVTYDVRNVGTGLGRLAESELAIDNTRGHQVLSPYGNCCGIQGGSFDPGVIIVAINSLFDGIEGDGFNACNNSDETITGQITDWYTGISAIATASPQTVKGISPGFTTLDGQGFTVDPNCTIVNFQVSPASITVTPEITSISPSHGLIGNSISVTISGAGFSASSPSISAGSGITATINSHTDTQIQATFAIASSTGGGNHNVTVTAGGQTSNTATFYVQIPHTLIRDTGYGTGGLGTLVNITNGNVLDIYGNVLLTGECGVYRNIGYFLVDQETPAQMIQGNYTLIENFTNYSTDVVGLSVPPTQDNPIEYAQTMLGDTQFFGTKASSGCPGSNDHESFDQNFTVQIDSLHSYGLSMVNLIERGYYSGTATVNVTISMP